MQKLNSLSQISSMFINSLSLLRHSNIFKPLNLREHCRNKTKCHKNTVYHLRVCLLKNTFYQMKVHKASLNASCLHLQQLLRVIYINTYLSTYAFE